MITLENKYIIKNLNDFNKKLEINEYKNLFIKYIINV